MTMSATTISAYRNLSIERREAVTVLSINRLGDGLRDALDPRMKL